jgi:hypothetical protein
MIRRLLASVSLSFRTRIFPVRRDVGVIDWFSKKSVLP